jgi:hypothetical protein
MNACHTVKTYRPPEFSPRREGVESDSTPRRFINRRFEAERAPMNIRPRSYPPAFEDIGGWLKNQRKKCQQKCQQNRTRVVLGQHSMIPPAFMVNTSFIVSKGRGELRQTAREIHGARELHVRLGAGEVQGVDHLRFGTRQPDIPGQSEETQ